MNKKSQFDLALNSSKQFKTKVKIGKTKLFLFFNLYVR